MKSEELLYFTLKSPKLDKRKIRADNICRN